MFKLRKQILDLSYHDESRVHDFQERARQVYYHKILGEMEHILKKYDHPEIIFRIDQIEIDLGIIDEDDFSAEWVHRFREQFEETLRQHIQLIQSGKGSIKNTQISLQKRHADIFEYYLLHGVFPWNADHKKHTPVSLAEELLVHQPSDLVSILKKHGHNEKFIRRLVYQLAEKQLVRIVEIVQPTEAAFIVETIEKIDVTRRREVFIKTDSLSFRHGLWQFVLAYILEDRGSYFNTREFVKSMLFRISDHFNMERVQLITQFYYAVSSLQKEISLSMGLQQIITDIYREMTEGRAREQEAGNGSPENSPSADTTGTETDTEEWTSTAGKNVPYILDPLIFNPLYAERIRSWLFRKGKDSDFRRKISEAIRTFQQFEKIIFLLDAQNAEYITDFSSRLQNQHKQQPIATVPASRFRKDHYYFILTALLTNRGSYFNKKSFVRSVLQQMSRQYGVELYHLLQVLVQALPGNMKGLSQLPEILQLLSELEKEEIQKKNAEKTITDHASDTRFWTGLVIAWIQNGSLPANIPEYTDLAHLSFEQVWTRFLAAGKIHEESISRIFSEQQHLRFLAVHLPDAIFRDTVRQLLPEDTGACILALYDIGQQVFSRIAATHIDSVTFREQQKVFVFSHIRAFHRREISTEAYMEKMLVFLAGTLKTGMSVLWEKLGELLPTYSSTSREIQQLAEKVKNQHRPPREVPVTLKAEILRFIRTHGNLPHASPVFQEQLLLAIKKWERSGPSSILMFLQEIFSPHAFLRFIRKHANTEWLHFLYRYPIQENGHFLSPLTDDLLRIIRHSAYRMADLQELINKALIYGWFREEKTEKNYTAAILVFLADIQKTAPEIFRETLRTSALEIKTELNSKIILYLTPDHTAAVTTPPSSQKSREPQPGVPFPSGKKENDAIESIPVKNAGIVLLWPFLTTYYSRLQLTTDNIFRDDEALQRAVHLLQYMAYPGSGYTEHELALPKLLCGLQPDDPVVAAIDIHEEEQQLSDSLLNGIIQQWSILKNTSVNAFRETFLARDGMLYRYVDRWELHVEPKSFDVLMDQRPWSIQIIRLPWMSTTLFCKWR